MQTLIGGIVNAVEVLAGNVRDHRAIGDGLCHAVDDAHALGALVGQLHALAHAGRKVVQEGVRYALLHVHQCHAYVKGRGVLQGVYVPATLA